MSKVNYQVLFNNYGLNDPMLYIICNIGRNEAYNEIEIIVQRHKIIDYYKTYGKLLPFEAYSVDDITLEKNIVNYCKALIQAEVEIRKIDKNNNIKKLLLNWLYYDNNKSLFSHELLDELEKF